MRRRSGLGSLGLLAARFLAERGARDVVLMGRTPVPARQSWDGLPEDHPQWSLVGKLPELESLGARIHLAAVDVADPDQLRQWRSAHHERTCRRSPASHPRHADRGPELPGLTVRQGRARHGRELRLGPVRPGSGGRQGDRLDVVVSVPVADLGMLEPLLKCRVGG
ncbi:KR domain-containing protein [Streptomyces azureus]|uniref:Ketoreductase (KR) domain-containing protein n=1 Tax=Streptomyces azureus TaxID=146537 RepID=A0A0K8PIT0_STRAJ|nr:KR domain-containing protein [Streptomyces azureus]GAP47633.1 uncharacterized protein SAZU_2370 [Streptomyces azureus]